MIMPRPNVASDHPHSKSSDVDAIEGAIIYTFLHDIGSVHLILNSRGAYQQAIFYQQSVGRRMLHGC